MKVENYFLLVELTEKDLLTGKFPYNKVMQFKFGSNVTRWKASVKKIDQLIWKFRQKEVDMEQFREEVIAYREKIMRKYPNEFEEGRLGWYDRKVKKGFESQSSFG